MSALGLDSLFTGLGLRASTPAAAVSWFSAAFLTKSVIPAIWFCFSLTYSRGHQRELLTRWRLPIALVSLIPVALSLWWLRYGTMATALNAVLLVALVLILMNLEQTFRSAVGTMRWRIKFVVLGLAVIFGARLYVRSQAILFSDLRHGLVRHRVERAPDRVCLPGGGLRAHRIRRDRRVSLTARPAIVADGSHRRRLPLRRRGARECRAGVLAERRVFNCRPSSCFWEWPDWRCCFFPTALRQRIHGFVGRHFARAQHDSVRIWTEFSRRLANVKDQAGLCAASAKLVSETFEVLSVTVWLLDEQKEPTHRPRVDRAATGEAAAGNRARGSVECGCGRTADADRRRSTWKDVDEPWAEELRRLNPTRHSRTAASVWCVPLRAGEQSLGALVLADRVNGAVYTVEELQLLQCIARPDDVGAVESAAGERGGACQGTGGVPDDVGVLRARSEERGRVPQSDAEEPAGAFRRPGVSRRTPCAASAIPRGGSTR